MDFKEKQRIRQERREKEQARIQRNIDRKRQRAFDEDLHNMVKMETSKSMRNAWKCASFMANKWRQ